MQQNALVQIDMHTPDEVLVAKTIDGDDVAFETILRRNNQLLFRTARSIVKNDAEAEDILQESYINAWQALGNFRSESKLSTWLVRIVVNEALGRLRRNKIDFLELDKIMTPENEGNIANQDDYQDTRPESQTLNKQYRKLIENGIDQLPDAFRTVFVLRAVEGLSAVEVAEILEIPQSTVRTRFFRARKLLQQILDKDIAVQDAFAFDGARCDRIVKNVLARKNSMSQS